MVRRSRRASGSRRTRRRSRHSMKSRRVRRMRHTRGRGRRGGGDTCASENDIGNEHTSENGNKYVCGCSMENGVTTCKWHLQ